jgi:hypothetical protein
VVHTDPSLSQPFFDSYHSDAFFMLTQPADANVKLISSKQSLMEATMHLIPATFVHHSRVEVLESTVLFNPCGFLADLVAP